MEQYPITSIDFCKSMVEVHYRLMNPNDDRDTGKKEIPYDGIENLIRFTRVARNIRSRVIKITVPQEIPVPQSGITICFEYYERPTGDGPPREHFEGPYLMD